MTRQLLCKACGNKTTLHPEDYANDWHLRKVSITGKKPADHAVTILTPTEPAKRIALSSLVCDLCNENLNDGDRIIAVTMWDSNREGEPLNWEQEYQQ